MRALDRLREKGIRRVGTPAAGFRYLVPGGRPVARREAERIRALKLPPAWTDVHVSPSPGAKLQAIGRDRAGRWQYRYHPDFAARRAGAKYRRLLRFADALPRLRAAAERERLPDGDLHAAANRKGVLEAERALVAFLRAAPGARRLPALRLLRGGSRVPERMRPTGATAKPLRRAARAPERE